MDYAISKIHRLLQSIQSANLTSEDFSRVRSKGGSYTLRGSVIHSYHVPRNSHMGMQLDNKMEF